jgi:hypothetical protein
MSPFQLPLVTVHDPGEEEKWVHFYVQQFVKLQLK